MYVYSCNSTVAKVRNLLALTVNVVSFKHVKLFQYINLLRNNGNTFNNEWGLSGQYFKAEVTFKGFVYLYYATEGGTLRILNFHTLTEIN